MDITKKIIEIFLCFVISLALWYYLNILFKVFKHKIKLLCYEVRLRIALFIIKNKRIFIVLYLICVFLSFYFIFHSF